MRHHATRLTAFSLALVGGLFMLSGCQSTDAGGRTASASATQPAAIETALFGVTYEGEPARLYTLTNEAGMKAKITNYGGTLVELHVPDGEGGTVDVVNGFDSLSGYMGDQNQYFGAIIGPVANRIADAQFTLDGTTYELPANDKDNTLHGGAKDSLDEVLWRAEPKVTAAGEALTLRYTHPDGQAGFPGNLDVKVTYTLTDDNVLRLTYRATTDEPTPVNLTNHSYFNLQGQGSSTIRDHKLMINAEQYTPVDDALIPTGEIRSLEGTPLDFSEPTAIGKRLATMKERPAGGYDHNYVLAKPAGEMGLAARVTEPDTGRVMSVHTTEPALQFYSGNFLNGQQGKGDAVYEQHEALCLETQNYPNAVNEENFPSIILKPGETYRQTTEYRFSNQ